MFLLAFQPLYFPDSFARSHSASFSMIIPSAVSTTGVITFIAKVNGFLLYIPIIQQISVTKNTILQKSMRSSDFSQNGILPESGQYISFNSTKFPFILQTV